MTPERRVGKQFGGRLVAGDHHEEQEAEHFFVGQTVTVDLGLQERRGEVVGEPLTTVGDHLVVIDHQVDGGLDSGLRNIVDTILAMHDPVSHGPDAVPVLERDTHQLGDDVHRQLAREVRDEVDCFAPASPVHHCVEMLDGELGDPWLELTDSARREAFRHQCAQAQVCGVVHREERHGLARMRTAGYRVEGDAVAIGQRRAVAKALSHVLVTRQRPEPELVVVVQRGIVTKPLVVRVRILVEVVVVWIEDRLAGGNGHRFSPRMRPTTYVSRSAISR